VNTPDGATYPGGGPVALLALAQEVEPRTSERTLEYWRNQDMLPKLVRIGQEGIRPVWVNPPGAQHQLEALLRHRKVTRDPNVLRTALWFDGFAVPIGRARDSAVAVFEDMKRQFDELLAKMVVSAESEGEARWLAINELARVLATKRNKGFPRMGRQSLNDRQRAIAAVLGLAFGEPQAMERLGTDAGAVERFMGIDRGRSFKPGGAGPWNEGPAAENLAAFARYANIDRLIQLLKAAHDPDLEQARAFAQIFVEGIALFSRIADALVGRDNASGMAAITTFVGNPYVGVMVPALMLSFVVEPGGIERLTMVTEAISGAVDPAKEAVADFLAQPKEERERRQANIDALPFPQSVAAKRLIAELGPSVG